MCVCVCDLGVFQLNATGYQRLVELRKELVAGTMDVFCGPAVNLPDGSCFDDKFLLGGGILSFDAGVTDKGTVRLPPPTTELVDVHQRSRLAIGTGVAVSSVLVLPTNALLVYHHKSPVMKAAAWKFDMIIQVGLCVHLLFLSIFL